MKTTRLIILTGVVMMYAAVSHATIRTCSNDFASPGQYTSLQAAINACSTSSMDTILVAGSSVDYSTVGVDRRVCIIGTGFNSSKQNPMKSILRSLDFTNANASHSQIIGLVFTNYIPSIYCNTPNVTGVIIKRCKTDYEIQIGTSASGNTDWLIEGCVINNLASYCQNGIIINNVSNIGGWVIRNNIISIGANCPQGRAGLNWGGTPAYYMYVLNNVFMGDGDEAGMSLLAHPYNHVNNNIFWRCIPGTNAANDVNSNMSYGGTSTSIPGTGSNPLAGVDPLFVNVGATQGNWTPTSDFNLSGPSQGNDAGNDGTDIGIYGGLVGLFLQSGEPDIPQISLFNITSPTSIPPGGTLDINVISKRHQ